MPSLTDLLYLQVAFDCFVGMNFVLSPQALFEGIDDVTATTFGRYAIESFGLSNIFYSLVLSILRTNTTMQGLNILYNALWAAHLGLTFKTAGYGWRSESALTSGDFAAFPCVAHCLFAVISLLAIMFQPSKNKNKQA